jgi:DNA-binding transcriptional LysR family regulator
MGRVTIVNLETLCWIARLGSFTAAAERLNTTQPAISKRVKELEDAIGISLFQRQGRRMELTVQGRDLVQRAQPLLTRLEDVVVFHDNLSAANGVIRMGVGEIVAVTWFAELMTRLKRLMPGVHYELDVGLTVDMRHRLHRPMRMSRRCCRHTQSGILPPPLVGQRLASKELRLLSPELKPQRLEFVVAQHRDQNQQIIQRIVEEAQLASSFLAR